MRLTELFTNNRPINDAEKTQTYSVRDAIVNRQIKALAPGQTIQGEVLSRNGSDVQLKLLDGLLLNAKLDQNMNLDIGKILTFEVRNNGSALTLSPLFANMATDANVIKALDMAGIPVSESTVNMTKQMMDAGLSVDRNSLQQVFRELNTFSAADVSDIVDLHKLGMPVNEENINQMASYKGLTHQLVGGMNEVFDALPQTFQGMLLDGNIEGAFNLYQELLTLIQAELPAILTENAGVAGEMVQGNVLGAGVVLAEGAEGVVEDGIIPGANQTDATAQAQVASAAVAQESGNGVPEAGKAQLLATLSEELTETIMNSVDNSTQLERYTDILKGLTQMADGSLDVSKQLSLMKDIFAVASKEGNVAVLKELIGNDKLQNLVTKELQNSWMIKPGDVADENKIEELYQRLDRQLKGLTKALEVADQTNSIAYNAANNMRQNLDFLQQFNQMYAYVQLPLKLQQGNANGDLYVYTNKRNLAASDGQISALLHLDMEHLGPVDVYVAMQPDKVNTKFYVQDDEMLDFLEAHMDILTDRLKKRGYNCSMEMQVRQSDEGTKSGIRPFLEKEESTPLVQYAFDVRA